MSQQMVSGIYYPHSMEANVNSIMYIANYPAVMCHELSHLKGFIREDEANFIGYLACVNSEDDFFVYSGYLSVISYLESDIMALEEAGFKANEELINLDDLVYNDLAFLADGMWEAVEENAIVDTKTVSMISSNVIDTSLKLNGVPNGEESYCDVVLWLLSTYKLKE